MESRLVKNQLIFRFKEPYRPSRQPKETVYHARRPHRKSRTGCLNCKKRRVKCDETKPNCQRCVMYGVSCDYSALAVQRHQPITHGESYQMAAGTYIPPSSVQFSMSVDDLADKINRVLQLDTSTDKAFLPVMKSISHRTVEFFHHFITMAAHASSLSDAHRVVMSGKMMQLAFQNPYLMHAVFGVAVTHLRHLLPHDKSFDIAAAIHWENALKLYRKEISKPIDEHNMDPLMSTCMLLGTIIFSSEECKPANSWIFSSDPTRLSWLLGQSGLRYILEAVSIQQLQQSIWFEAFMESDDENHSFNNNSPGREGLHPELADLCEIDETTTEESNPYHWPVRMLSPMLPLKADRNNFGKLITFIGRLEPVYTKLLQEKDPRALLILSHWLGKMCEEDQWWIYHRVSSECFAICMFLEHNEDPRIVNLLQYPAEKCGYVLDHVLKEMIVQDSDNLVYLP
ncbi:C6 transcription factor [Blastomyces dermatitidis ATCC 18188]|uniref:C6 transcription factor n=2 Tax=Ajellomyces dermatitidis (strain ATCC 18188 / CBS 674.68) TaxID=653446 RepID=F2TI41_AJEDA|nr:C6 transcription factor [Blastomyces dermatitidis ATCC 18188]